MEYTKTKHIEEWEIHNASPLDRVRIESDNDVELQITLFGIDGNIVEEATLQQVYDANCSDELLDILQEIGVTFN